MTEKLFHGYDYNSIQPSLRAQQKIRIDSPVDVAAVREWLLTCFGADETSLPQWTAPASGDGEGQARAAMDCAFAVYSELLRGAGIPVFPEGLVLEVETADAKSGIYTVHFSLPVLDNLPVSLFAGVLKEALRLVLGPLNQSPTLEAATKLMDELDRNVVQVLKTTLPVSTACVSVCGQAFSQSIPFRHLGLGVMRLGTGARSQLLFQSSVERDSAIGAHVASRKQASALHLHSAGFPVAMHFDVSTPQEAVAAARRLGWPVVLKPEDRERSEGVTVNIQTEAALLLAFERARKLSERLLVERHVPGLGHRFMIAGGQAIYIVKRLPKGLEGDGVRTVQQLADAANERKLRQPPWKRLPPYQLDDLALACLAENGLSPQAVPKAGQWAPFRLIPSTAEGGDVVHLTDEAHPDNIRLALDVAKLLGLSSAGVDIMSTDITRPWHENGAIVNEVNYLPGFTTAKREQHAARLMPAIVEGDGRIPVHLVTGSGNLFDAAQELKKRLKKKGGKCHLVSADHAEDAQGKSVHLAAEPLFERSLALLMRPNVQELIIVATRDEIFAGGIAADRLDNVWIVGKESSDSERLSQEIRQRFRTNSIRQA